MSKKFDKVFLELLFKRVDVHAFLDKYHAHVTSGEVATHRGHEIRMHCVIPGHRDNNASASFNVDTGLYNCWSRCGGFTFWKLVQELENLQGFKESVEFVQRLVGFDDDDEIDDLRLAREKIDRMQLTADDKDSAAPTLVEIDLDKVKDFEDALGHMDVVSSRVDEQMVRNWNLKYAVSGYYEGRLIIPFYVGGKVVSFAARDMLGRADRWNQILKKAKERNLTRTEVDRLKEEFEFKKIIYPPTVAMSSHSIVGSPTQFILFNIDQVMERGKDLGYVILTEGPFDAMKISTWGFNAVALLGLKLSSYKKAQILKNFSNVYVCLDNDDKSDGSNPGQDAAMEIVRSLHGEVDVRNIKLPKGKDPDDCELSEFEDCLKSAEEF